MVRIVRNDVSNMYFNSNKNVIYFTSSFLSNVGFKCDLVLLENQPVYF